MEELIEHSYYHYMPINGKPFGIFYIEKKLDNCCRIIYWRSETDTGHRFTMKNRFILRATPINNDKLLMKYIKYIKKINQEIGRL